ncbi:MAG: hypothetical protein R2867_33885 [Caldilineaceae bacterium]
MPESETRRRVAGAGDHAVSVMDPPEKCRAIIEAVGSDNLRLIMDPGQSHFQCLQQVYQSTDWVNHIF